MIKLQVSHLYIAAALALLSLCQCTTRQAVARKAGFAHFNVTPQKGNLAGLRGVRIASVNGTPVDKKSAYVKAGKVDAVVSVAWPSVGKCQIPVKFRAKEGRAYFMRYDQYPMVKKTKPGTNKAVRGMLGVSGHLVHSQVGAILALPIAGAAIVTGFVSDVSHGISGSGGAKLKKSTTFIDLMVISELNSEGVVSHVRAYASGRVEIRMQR